GSNDALSSWVRAFFNRSYPCCKGPAALLAQLEGLLVSHDRAFGTYQGFFVTKSHA
ncbi:unnamed protein product, partial [Ceratitis capitata]